MSIRNETVEYLCALFCLVDNTAFNGGAVSSDNSFSMIMRYSAVSAGTSSEKGAPYNDAVHTDNCKPTLGLSTNPVVVFRKSTGEGQSPAKTAVSTLWALSCSKTTLLTNYGGAMDLGGISQLILNHYLT